MARLLLLSLLALPLAADEMWVELGPAENGFSTIARYASRDAKNCPAIALNGHTAAMKARTNTGKFAGLVCESTIPPGTRKASIKGQKLPLPSWSKKTKPVIVVIGDTGCRIKQGGEDGPSEGGKWNIQNCASPADWPFLDVANHASAVKPDLVIHVGDFLYREKACTGQKDCPGGPSGDTLETWEADFFTPAKNLLLAAPWIFARGNHEDCTRSGDGWFTLLDPRSITTCMQYSDPYLLKTNLGISIAMVDSNPAMDVPCKPNDSKCAAIFREQVETYTHAFETISSWKLQHAWLVTHRPVWSVRATGEAMGTLNAVEEAAWKKSRPQGIDLLLAGHTHIFEMIGFDPAADHSMQLVVGNSGTKLVPIMKYDSAAPAVKEASINDFRKRQDFGFTTLMRAGAGWQVQALDRDGRVDIACEVEGGKARCKKENQ
jgi:predicted phosphodiesterase